MHKIRNTAAFIFFIALVVYACKKNESVYPSAGPSYYQYFPLKVGAWKIYEVDSIDYSFLDDSVHYQMKETVIDMRKDNSGHYTYTIQQSTRKDTVGDWQVSKIYTARIENNEAIVTYDNIPYLRIVFPPNSGERWNSNKYNNVFAANNVPVDDYSMAKYLAIHQPYQLNKLKFDSTLLVRSFRDSTAISRTYFVERYAAQVGLIEMMHDSTESNIKPTEPNKGYSIRQHLVSYGK